MTRTVAVRADNLEELAHVVNQISGSAFKGVSTSFNRTAEGGYEGLVTLPGVHSFDHSKPTNETNNGAYGNLRQSALEVALNPNTTTEDFRDYKVESREDLINKYKLNEEIIGNPKAKWIAYQDIFKGGYKVAAEKHGMELREFKETYGLLWKDISKMTGLNSKQLDYVAVGEKVGLTLQEMGEIDPRLKRTLRYKAKKKGKPIPL